MKQRDLAIDYAKGIAILLVYLGHSILYYPINLYGVGWCFTTERMIASCNMHMFFLISGILFGFSRKTWREIVIDKTKRLVVPYLFTMFCVIVSKMLLPSSMAYNDNQDEGIFYNVFVKGGDRWFVYVLIWMFIIAIPLKKKLKTSWLWLIISIPIIVTLTQLAPTIFLIDLTMKYIPFFFLGMYMSNYYQQIKIFLIKSFSYISILFVILNICLVTRFSRMPFVWDYVLPIIGTAFFAGLAVLIEKRVFHKSSNKIFDYISYSGKYSLQFYLFSFAYPIIRTVVVSILHIYNPLAIVTIIFFGQLVAITIIIEITKRVRILRIPMGY